MAINFQTYNIITNRKGEMGVESIMDCTQTDNTIASGLSHVYRNGLNTGPTNRSLLQLPPELRLLVYGPLIAGGDLSIMRTSKLIHDEAVKLLKTHAVLRMFLHYANRTSSALVPLTATVSLEGSLTIHASPVIQRIEFHLNQLAVPYGSLSVRFDVYADLIKSFGGRDVARQSCIIYLELGLFDAVPGEWNFLREKAWIAIANLTGFETLTLKILRKRDLFLKQAEPRRWRKVQTSVKESSYRTKYDYNALGAMLNSTLGPATFCRSPTGGDFLEFHPSDFKPVKVP